MGLLRFAAPRLVVACLMVDPGSTGDLTAGVTLSYITSDVPPRETILAVSGANPVEQPRDGKHDEKEGAGC